MSYGNFMIYIKNISGGALTIRGNSINNGAYYLIPLVEVDDWASDANVFTLISDGDAQIAKDDSGTGDISELTEQWEYLTRIVPEVVDVGLGTLVGAQGPQGDTGANGFGIYAFSNTSSNGTVLKARGLTVSKTATGTYQYSFTTATPDANYIPTASFFNLGTNTDTNYFIDNKTVNGFTLTTGTGDNGSSVDTLTDLNHGVTVLGDASPQGITSAYEAWLSLGNTGTEQDFIDTLVGPQGPQGIQGVPGGFANYTYAESESESSTTSASYQQKLKLTTPSLSSGNYLIQFYCEITSTDNDGIAAIVELDDTTTIAEMKDDRHHSEDYFKPFSGFKQVTLTSGVHEIDIDYRKLGGTAKIRRARISITGVS
mgnify:FL=1